MNPILYDDLSKLDPAEVCRRTRAAHDPETGAYALTFWGRPLQVNPLARTTVPLDGEFPRAWAYVDLVAVHYLLLAQKVPVSGEWVSEKDIPGGSAFFRGPHTLPTQGVAARFDQDLEGFSRLCRQQGGQSLAMADAAFAFDLLPSVPVAVLLWQGDAEFPGEARLLFDRTVATHLPLDIIYALAVVVCHTLAP